MSVRPLPTVIPLAPQTGIERHRVAVWRYLRMLGADATEADDLAQETMLIGCEHALSGDDRDRAFLRGVAKNLWLRTRRWWRRRRPACRSRRPGRRWGVTARPRTGPPGGNARRRLGRGRIRRAAP